MLKVSGEVEVERTFGFEDLRQLASQYQIPDFSVLVPNRPGIAVKLEGILNTVRVSEQALYLSLHSSLDDFHASIPLDEVRERGFVIYGLADGTPLPEAKGGPVRFFIPDHAECKADEIDECANVKFVDHMELTSTKGFDNRPTDEEEHAKLHGH